MDKVTMKKISFQELVNDDLNYILSKLELNEFNLNELNSLMLIALKYSFENNECGEENLNERISNIIKGNIKIENLLNEIKDVTLILQGYFYSSEEGQNFEDNYYPDYDPDSEIDYLYSSEILRGQTCSICGAEKGRETNDCCPWSD